MNNKWYSLDEKKIYKLLDTSSNGLKQDEAMIRLQKYGFNIIKGKNKKNIFKKLLEQFKDFSIIILIITAIISFVVGMIQGDGIVDSIIIIIVVIMNAFIGVAQEKKAEKSLEALQKLSDHSVKVFRDGNVVVIPSINLTIGDVVLLEAGDYVAADLRLIEAVNLKVQESSLTGESVPIEKDVAICEAEIPLSDRKNMLYSSSLVTYGRGKAVVVDVGMNTEVGKIAKMIDEEPDSKTPLQVRLDKVGKTLGLVSIVICVVIFIVGLIEGKEPLNMFMTSVSLAVAAIPEGLVAVSTIVLAIGVERMVSKNAIVKKLPAVETLGSASIICTDKTGTLTQNKMSVKQVYCDNSLSSIDNSFNSISFNYIMVDSLLCNDSKLDDDNNLIGDPTEIALMDIAIKKIDDCSDILKYSRIYEIPFDSERKLMTTVNKISDNKYLVCTKGAVDELLKRCDTCLSNDECLKLTKKICNEINNNNDNMASLALRVLGFAYKEIDHMPSSCELEMCENNLIFVGLLGMIDPPRDEVKIAINKCKRAGIKTVMITGDHKITAMTIARELGILKYDSEVIEGMELDKMSDSYLIQNVDKYSVYARVSPEHKVRIVNAWQKRGQIVAMTGDGVNDSPALKRADIGCAMGIVGTEVSKEAADVILTDDNFTTIVSAVEEGRKIYDNILKVIHYLISSNVGEICVILLATLLTPLLVQKFNLELVSFNVLLPIHILWINLVTDTLPALFLSFDPASFDIMERPPINSSCGVFTKSMVYRIVYQGIMIGILTLLAFILGITSVNVPIDGMTLSQTKISVGQTMAFVSLSLMELLHVFNIRDNSRSIFKVGILNNKRLLLSTIISFALVMVILLVPLLRNIFGLVVLSKINILEIIVIIFIPIFVVELFKLFKINGNNK